MADPLRYPDPKPDTRRRWVKVFGVIALIVVLLVVVVMLAGGGSGGHGPGRHTGGGDTGSVSSFDRSRTNASRQLDEMHLGRFLQTTGYVPLEQVIEAVIGHQAARLATVKRAVA